MKTESFRILYREGEGYDLVVQDKFGQTFTAAINLSLDKVQEFYDMLKASGLEPLCERPSNPSNTA